MTTEGRSLVGVARAAIVGVGAYLAGYAVFYLLEGAKLHAEFREQVGFATTGVSPPPEWQVTGIYYFVVHRAPLQVSVTGDLYADTRTVEPAFFEPLGTGSTVVPWLIPPVAIGLGGALLAVLASADDSTGAAKAGSTVAVGYLPAVLAALVAFPWSGTFQPTGRTLSVGTDPFQAVAFGGVLYPLVVGTLGGFVGHVVLARAGVVSGKRRAADRRNRRPVEGSADRTGSPGPTGETGRPDAVDRQGDSRTTGPDRREPPDRTADSEARPWERDDTPRYRRTGDGNRTEGDSDGGDPPDAGGEGPDDGEGPGPDR